MNAFRIVCLLCVAVVLTFPAVAEEQAIGLKFYADEMNAATFSRVNYGYDRDTTCPSGTCDNGSPCANHQACAGIGSGLCNYTACKADFDLCEDDTTICADNADCTGIGSGTCVPNPCAPPNQLCGVQVDTLTAGAPTGQTIWEMVCDPATTPISSDCQVGVALPDNVVSWDFSGFNTTALSDLIPTATTTTPINASETSNHNECGFNPGGAHPQRTLGREDKNYPATDNFVPTLNPTERQVVDVCDDGKLCSGDGDCSGIGDGICDPAETIWLRGVVRYEGIDGADLGEGESRLCHIDDDGSARTQLPLWRFLNQDGGEFYMELDDTWSHTPVDCEPTILFPAAVKTNPSGGFAGRQSGEIVNEGVVKLPSGHQFQALVSRTVTEYSVWIDFIVPCAISVDDVRTSLYLWVVPHLGTVVRLQSDKLIPDVRLCDDGDTLCGGDADCTGIGSGVCNAPTPGELLFAHLAEADVKYGLFPPLSLSVDAIGESTVDLSWDPGLITDHIKDYRIYWDTESGGACSIGGEDCTADHPGAGDCTAGQTCCGTPGAVCDSYGFDSVNDPGQVVFNTATSATISGLDPNTTYHFTVTTRSDFTDPSSLVTTTYESVLYPTQIPAVPQDLPIEVSAQTTGGGGGPAGAVPDGDERPGPQLIVAKGAGNSIDLSWGASCRVDDDDYGIYEGIIGDFDGHLPSTCTTGGLANANVTPGGDDRYYLVVPSNGIAEGSYGLESSGAERPTSAAPCLGQDIDVPVCAE